MLVCIHAMDPKVGPEEAHKVTAFEETVPCYG